MNDGIEIVGARTNNLKSIDAVLPLRMATMVVGVSGSGKSSLLADTLATEANARMRRFLGVSQPHLSDDDVPAFLGPLPPSIHFAQAAFRASRRTTVGTSTGHPRSVTSLFQSVFDTVGRGGQMCRFPAVAIQLCGMDGKSLHRFVDRMDGC